MSDLSPTEALRLAEEIEAIPGDAAGIRTQAGKYSDMAEIVSRAAQDLKIITANPAEYSSEATGKWLEKTESVIPDLEKVKNRYEVAGTELAAFAEVLAQAQETARAAVTTRDNNVDDVRHYQGQIMEAGAQPLPKPGDDGPTPQEEVNRLEGAAEPYISAIAGAHSSWKSAKESVKERGDLAEDRLNSAIDADGLTDSWWDDFTGALDSFVDWAAPFLKVLKNILTVVAAIVGILSIFFPILAPLALGLALATLALSTTLALSGNGSWADVALDAVGVLSFGVGMAAGRMAQGAATLLKANRISRLTRLKVGRGIEPSRALRLSTNKVTNNFNNAMRNGLRLSSNPSLQVYRQNPRLILDVMRNGSVDGARFAQLAANASRGRSIGTDAMPMALGGRARGMEIGNNILGAVALSGYQAVDAVGALVGGDKDDK
jgi:hypothetical protein